MIWAAPVIVAVALAERSPDQKQAMVDLAYVLGEAHALRQACTGPDEQTWRGRMSRMIVVEAPEAQLKSRMIDSFNAGFMTRRAENPTCGPEAAEAERAMAERGQALAQRLGGEPP